MICRWYPKQILFASFESTIYFQSIGTNNFIIRLSIVESIVNGQIFLQIVHVKKYFSLNRKCKKGNAKQIYFLDMTLISTIECFMEILFGESEFILQK